MRRKMFKKEDIVRMLREFDTMTGNDTSKIRVRVEKEIDGGAIACYRCNRLNGAPIEFVFTKAVCKCSEEFVRDIVAHEYGHYVRNTVMGNINENDLHDEGFINAVYALGSVNVEAELSNEMAAEFWECNPVK